MARDKKTRDCSFYEYDWRYDGCDAVYCVELSYDERESELGDVLVTVCCKGGKHGLTGIEYRRYERLRDKLLRKCPLKYVGLIETHKAVYFFFYAENHEVATTLDKQLRHIADKVSYDCRYDREKDFYKSTLIPDTAKVYTEENRNHLKMFEVHGDCMTAPRKINFHVVFPTEPLKILFEEQIKLSGYAIGETVYTPEQELSHGVIVHKILPLSKPEIDDSTTRIIAIAKKHEGELAFWDCVLVPGRRSK